jgi:tetratricopeptide (TPR) repeat protein
MGKLESAQETFGEAQALAPKSPEVLRCLAAVALERHDFKQALALHKQLLELDEAPVELLYNTGLLLQKLGRAKEAAGYYQKALDQRPGFPQALLNLGHALMSLGRQEEAHTCWQAALRSDVELTENFLV